MATPILSALPDLAPSGNRRPPSRSANGDADQGVGEGLHRRLCRRIRQPSVPFALSLTGPAAAPTGFQFDLEPASSLLKLPTDCRPATVQSDAAGRRRIEPAATPDGRVRVILSGAGSTGGAGPDYKEHHDRQDRLFLQR